MFELVTGDCFEVLSGQQENQYDSVVTDPPYGLSFMGKDWDHGVPGIKFWKEILRVSKPGAHLLAFGGTRTYHRLMCAIEDAGWEIRDCVMWVYGSGFPKSLDVSKAIDKAAGAERAVVGVKVRGDVEAAKKSGATYAAANANKNNKAIFGYGVEQLTEPATDAAKQWQGWGTALKPAWEPIILARKPLEGTVAENVLKWGTGSINIDGSRVPIKSKDDSTIRVRRDSTETDTGWKSVNRTPVGGSNTGRWPANLIHDGSEEVLQCFPYSGKSNKNAEPYSYAGREYDNKKTSMFNGDKPQAPSNYNDEGLAARFFYCAKANKKDRGEGNNHPTVKPTDLMRYLCKLVTPPCGTILDPFCGSGSTGKAALTEGFNFFGIDLNQEYIEIAKKRLENV